MTTLATPAPLLSVTDVAERLNVSRATVYRLVQAGELPALRVGHSLRIDRDELREWLADSATREDPDG